MMDSVKEVCGGIFKHLPVLFLEETGAQLGRRPSISSSVRSRYYIHAEDYDTAMQKIKAIEPKLEQQKKRLEG